MYIAYQLGKGLYVIDIAWDWVFYETYRHKHEGEAPKASCLCILQGFAEFLQQG